MTGLSLYTKRALATSELILAASFWGFGFIASIWALKGMDAVTLTGLRFFFAFCFGILIVRSMSVAKIAIVPGLLMGLALFFQTWGLVYTTATKSTFITCLYVIFVPLLEAYITKKRLSWLHMFFTVLALVGLVILADAKNLSHINFGDFLTFICALLSTLHICILGRVAPKVESPFALNTWQCLWAALPMLFLVLLTRPTLPDFSDMKVLYGLGFLTFFSSMLAFWFMVRAQRYIEPSLASIFFLLETPFGAFFAYYFVGEKLSFSQWMGAVLIFIAVLGALVTEFNNTRALKELQKAQIPI